MTQLVILVCVAYDTNQFPIRCGQTPKGQNWINVLSCFRSARH